MIRPALRHFFFVITLITSTAFMLYCMTDVFGGTVIEHPQTARQPEVKWASTDISRLPVTINHDQGRLGNKLFKYASLLGIARSNGRVPVVGPYVDGVNLAGIFNLSHVDPTLNAKDWMEINETNYAERDDRFMSLPPRPVKVHGYVQSWRYFYNIRDEIRREFQLQERYRQEAQTWRSSILDSARYNAATLVAVHVRMRDEFSNPNTTEAPPSFYTNAFNTMRALLPGARLLFIVTGNNLQWCQDNLQAEDVLVLQPDTPEVHFSFLSVCDHGIVSAGTFGWWAAWLTGGHVVYYKRFPIPESYEAIGFVAEHYYPPSWIPVDH
ncbi:galactoside alpha-(1,2)-fucosyltransferase 2-like [Physella acuta]|uniref:galactoside alpha-(1,2)-fucosyltransferase 2-like n=1 Tax=Physella acuta TaxID=109671 RepID=UPI0027DB53BA|nr:galactoside alpha-(1,2)-fucosyltransferase 2-like [Physella acuta]